MRILRYLHGRIMKLTGRKNKQNTQSDPIVGNANPRHPGHFRGIDTEETETINLRGLDRHGNEIESELEILRMTPGQFLHSITTAASEDVPEKITITKYETSFYYMRVDPPITTEENEDYEKFSKVYERLNDVYIPMPNITEAFHYAKEMIHNPANDESWERVLTQRFIPYNTLQWNPITKNNENTEFSCDSRPIVAQNGDKFIIRIKIFAETPEQRRGHF